MLQIKGRLRKRGEKPLRIVMLIENTAVSSKLLVEHGMSLYIEIDGRVCIFGTGASSKLINNAKRMNLPLENADALIIPHNHFAFSGGIDHLLQINPKARIYALRSAECRPVRKKGPFYSPLGNLSEKVKKHRDNFVLFKGFQQVFEGFFLLKDEIRDESFYVTDKNWKINSGNGYIPEEMDHECFGALFPYGDRKKGCIILGGCAHCGLPNMIRTVKKNWGDIPIISIVTGLHLMDENPKKLTVDSDFLKRTAEAVREENTGAIYTCHCTGIKGYEELKTYLGTQLQYLQTGEELSF